MVVKLDSNALAALLKSPQIDSATKEAAEKVAANVRDMGIEVGDRDGGPREYDLPVKVFPHTTDRSHVVVALAHPSGEAVQAKHGALTKAAAQAGLDVGQFYVTKAGKRRRASQAQIDNWTRGSR